jgi:hypothetical protein
MMLYPVEVTLTYDVTIGCMRIRMTGESENGKKSVEQAVTEEELGYLLGDSMEKFLVSLYARLCA